MNTLLLPLPATSPHLSPTLFPSMPPFPRGRPRNPNGR